jgi:hypothetical protein
MSIPFTMTNDSITVIHEGKSNVTRKGAPNYALLRQALLEERWDDVPKHLTLAKSLAEYAKGKFSYESGSFYYMKSPLPSTLNDRIAKMATEGQDPAPLFKFWERLQKNPSYRSVNQLWGFLTHEGIPLTEDGCFLAYKSVRTDYKDHHSGEYDNHPGVTNEMDRNKVSDDPAVACHEGFHVGALQYAQTFGDGGRVIVICKVDPADVVCVPNDYSQQKMRVCKYKVVGVHNGQSMPSTVVPTSDFDEIEDEAEMEEEDIGDAPAEGVFAEDGEDVEEGDEGGDDEDPMGDINPPADVDPADYQKDPPAKKKKAKPASKKEAQPKMPSGYKGMEKKEADELLKYSIEELRQYASKKLKVLRAWKIPGGKLALIDQIIKARGADKE